MKKISIILVGIVSCMFACSQGDPASPQSPTPPSVIQETPPTETSDTDAGVSTPAPQKDSGTTPQPQVDSGPKEPTNQAECLSKCETDHPEGKLKADAITACWAAKCDPACTFMPDRQDTNVGPATSTKVCSGPGLEILTPSPSCSQCTHDECCNEWAECFSGLQADCTLLNQCANECWTKFAN